MATLILFSLSTSNKVLNIFLLHPFLIIAIIVQTNTSETNINSELMMQSLKIKTLKQELYISENRKNGSTKKNNQIVFKRKQGKAERQKYLQNKSSKTTTIK